MLLFKTLYIFLLRLQLYSCWIGMDDSSEVALFMRRKLDLLSDRNIKRVSTHSVAPDASQYDIALRQLQFHFNRSFDDLNVLFARTRNNGDPYLLIGTQISRVTINEGSFNLEPIATVADVNEKITEFEIEELPVSDNKGFLVVALYLRGRFQIYQISNNVKSSANVKSIQKIGRSGRSTKSFLVQGMSNLLLITGYMESDSGKIAVYRWINMHFSLYDVKELSQCEDMLVFSSSNQLVILALGLVEYPQRSVNNIFMLNSQFKLVKTQEMFFYFDRLPHYEIENQFYILRCLALGKCFIYKLNDENLFRRVSKIGFDPRSVDFTASVHNIAVISLERTLYFFNNQPLLKLASSYVVIDERGAVVGTSFMIAAQVNNVFLKEDRNTKKLYLYLLYTEGPKLIDVFEVRFNKGRSSPSTGEQSNFNALKTCLKRIKDMVNIRKNWIDLIKYQLKNTLRTCKSTGTATLASRVFVANTNKIDSLIVEKNIDKLPLEFVSEWNTVKTYLTVSHSKSKDLFYLNRMNTMQSNLKIRGNLHTKSTKMKSVKVHANQGINRKIRSKKDTYSSRMITPTIVNAREIVYKGNIFANTLSRNNVNFILSPVYVTNIYTPTVLVGLNTINRIPIMHMLFNATDIFMESGHKVFKAIDSHNIKAFLLGGKKVMQRFSSLRSFINPADIVDPTKLSGTHGVANLVINGRLNNVPVIELFQQLFYADKNPTINGNVFLRGVSYIANVYTRSLNSFPSNNYFDLRTNQTISATMHLSQVYAKNLNSKTINRIHIPEDVTLISSTETIKAALASNFVVLKDLTLSSEDQHFTKHVLGTKVEDFSQLYTGRVHLKGSLKLNKVHLESQGQLLLRGLTVRPEPIKHFWMKHSEQEIGSFTFNRHVETYHLVCGELNYNPTVNYLRSDSWPLHLSIEMSKVHIRGFVKTYVSSPTFLHYIHSEAVQRGSMSTVSGRKVFSGHLQADTIVADAIDSMSIQSLVTDTSTLAFLDGAKQIQILEAEECYIELLGELSLQDFHNVSFATIVESSANIHNLQRLEYLILPDIKVEHLQAALINGVYAKDFITEIDNFTYRVDPFATQFKIDNLVVRKNIISTSQIFMEYLNTVNVKEYLKLLTLKDDHNIKRWEIGGCKTLQKGFTVDGKLNVLHINHLILDSLLYNSARKSIPQNIVGLWHIGHLGTKYIGTKQINDVPTKFLQNSNLKTFKIKHDIYVETLLVSSNVHGVFFPNSSTATMPPNIQSIASLSIHGSFLLQQWKPGTFFYDILLSTVTCKTEVYDKKIIFDGNSINILNIWNEGKIFSRSCNFIQVLIDSVKKLQNNLVFSSNGKSFIDVIHIGSVTSNDLITAALVNGIDVIDLNRTIHPVGHQQEMIKSTKYFEEEVKVVQLLCNDELTGNLYPHHLKPHSETSKMTRKRYHFEKPTFVIGNLYVDAINDYSLQHFLSTRVLKNQSFAQEYHREKSQQVIGYITFLNLVLSNEQNTVHVINGIPTNEIVSTLSNEHQVMVEPKHLKGTIHLLGPTSIMTCNGKILLDVYKSSYMVHAAELFFKKLIFTEKGTLQSGLFIENTLNGVSMQKMTKLRLSSVEDLLPLIPVIREQLAVSSNEHFVNSAVESHMMYIQNVPSDDHNKVVQSTANQQFMETADSITFDHTFMNGVNVINITVHKKTSDGKPSIVYTFIDGIMISSEWKELSHNDMLVVMLVERKGKTFLVVIQHKHGALNHLQELPLNSFDAAFYLVPVADTSLLMAVSDSLPLQLNRQIFKLKLYYYDPITMQFIHFKTFSGTYNTVVALQAEEMIMIAISEISSKMLEIFAMNDSYSSLYQKVIFDSTVASLKAFTLQGFPALEISTVDNLVYVYVHNVLEGWKQLSYGRQAAEAE